SDSGPLLAKGAQLHRLGLETFELSVLEGHDVRIRTWTRLSFRPGIARSGAGAPRRDECGDVTAYEQANHHSHHNADPEHEREARTCASHVFFSPAFVVG